MVTTRRRRCRTATALLGSIHLRRNPVVAIAITIAATVLVAPSAGATTRYTQLAAGDGYTCGLTRAGRIVCKGYNRYGQTNVPEGRYRAVDAGPFSLTCALTQARRARCWGFGRSAEKKPHGRDVRQDRGRQRPGVRDDERRQGALLGQGGQRRDAAGRNLQADLRR
ncbi:MAG: hypothetical protein KY433_03795 [Actinobacteria bacterium]|nr:hypothetical protein [Actinomycetota bacterium]